MSVGRLEVTDYDLGPGRIYIGRGTPLGNPYTHVAWFARNRPWMTVVATREEAVSLYEPYIREKITQGDPAVCAMLDQIWRRVVSGEQVKLVCHCKPLACHGDIVKKIIEEHL